MWKRLRGFKLSPGAAEWFVAASILGVVAGLALSAAWVFRGPTPPGTSRSVWNDLLADRVTLGLVRLLVAVAAFYALVSIGVLISRRRWVRAISAAGIEVEAVSQSEEVIRAMERDLQDAVAERDEAWRLVWRLWRG